MTCWRNFTSALPGRRDFRAIKWPILCTSSQASQNVQRTTFPPVPISEKKETKKNTQDDEEFMTGQAGLALTSVTFFSRDHMEAPESRTAPCALASTILGKLLHGSLRRAPAQRRTQTITEECEAEPRAKISGSSSSAMASKGLSATPTTTRGWRRKAHSIGPGS